MERISNHPVADLRARGLQVSFSFDGQAMSGHAGEMLSSALFANGVRTFSEHRKGGAPQGIFCANGQCSQCAVIVDGILCKSCITPLAADMDVRTPRGVPELPKISGDSKPVKAVAPQTLSCEVLVIGAGPSGLSAAMELAERGFDVILADDKEDLGGKLVLQTHKFFGSEEDCYAGTRGYDIAKKLEEKLRKFPNARIIANSPVVGIYKDRKAGLYKNYKEYLLVDFKALVVAAGAREKSILFPGNDLPGVYGAGAFQTLVNRDLVKAASKVFVIGSGNVGLIGSYHALQAGIQVAGICEILPKINGYKVHADKIIRMGVPVHLNHTVISVEGDGKVERVTIAQVDNAWKPLLETAKTFEVDTVLVAAGLSPCDEFYKQALDFGFTVVKAGDAEEIAEASSAMFGGKIAALALAKVMGRNISIDQSWLDKREILKSKPGDIIKRQDAKPGKTWKPVFFCTEEIPCNPCTTVCPTKSIRLEPLKHSMLDLPYFYGDDCKGCMACVAACPGLAVSLLREIDDQFCEVQLPFEFMTDGMETGSRWPLLNENGLFLEDGELLKKFFNKKYRTWILTFKVSRAIAAKVIGIRIQSEEVTAPLAAATFSHLPDEAIVCRCERVSVGEIVKFIKDNEIRDVNQLKTIRIGMGACGSKTCSVLMPQIFRKAGVDPAAVTAGSLRPMMLEVGMGDIVNGKSGGAAL